MDNKLFRDPLYVDILTTILPRGWTCYNCGRNERIFIAQLRVLGVTVYMQVADVASWVEGVGFTRSRRLL